MNTELAPWLVRLAQKVMGEEAYQVKLFSTHTRPRVQPTVVSPRRVRQLKSRSVLISLPKTRAVKIMRTAAQA